MIRQFEEYTHELTAQEARLIPLIHAGFLTHIGKSNIIKGRIICETFNNNPKRHQMMRKYGVLEDYKLTPTRLGKFVQFFRNTDGKFSLPVIATQKGYYVSHETADIQHEIDALRTRAGSMYKSARAMQKFLKPKPTVSTQLTIESMVTNS